MNFPVKKTFKRSNILNGFRKVISYVLIFSLLWQNSLWASYGLYTIEEELEGSRVRTYNSRNIGIVEPGTIRDNEIHNVFEDLQLLENGGIVFTGAPDATKIYNRIYNANLIQLSGVIEADYPLPMVFANPGGIILENPDFQNIHDLTLAAGSLALTNKGMAYGVDEGSLTINKTFVQEINDVKNLSLAGRGIRINQSFLSPSESLILRAGQHMKGWNTSGEWVSEDYIEPNHAPLLENHSIFLNDTTILRSNGLYIESLDEGASIHAGGLLQSTGGDIVIRAKGDVYVNNLFAHRNLKIKTTGRVFLENQAFVGGAVKIKAAEIINQGRLIGAGKITFDAPWSKNNGFIKTEALDAKGFLNGIQGRIEAKSMASPLPLLSRNLGHVEIQDDLKLNCGNEILKGTIKTHGKIEVSGQELILDGNLFAQNGVEFKGLKKFTNKQNSSLSAFGAGFQGKLTDLENEGKMDLSSVNAQILGTNTNKKTGVIRIRGHSILQGTHQFNYGTIFTCGIHQTTLTGSYEDNGIFYSPTLFLLQARDIKYMDSHQSFLKDGVIRAQSDLTVGGNVSFTLNGNRNSCSLKLLSSGGNSKYFSPVGDLNFNGRIEQSSSSPMGFPLLKYFTIFNQPSVFYGDFSEEIALLSLSQSEQLIHSFGSEITLQAERNIDCTKAIIRADSGTVIVDAGGTIDHSGAQIKSGHFNNDNATVKGKIINFINTTVESIAGHTLIAAQEKANLNNCHFQGGVSANVISQNLWMDKTTVHSAYGSAGAHGTQVANINHSSFCAQSNVSVASENSLTINHSSLEGQSTVASGGKRLTFSHNAVEGEYNRFMADHIKAESNNINGPALFSATKSLKIHDLQATEAIATIAPTSTFSGRNTADFLTVQSKVIEQLGTIKTNKGAHLEASERYLDSPQSHNEAGGDLSLIAPKTNGFKGTQKAGETLEVVLKDMNILDLLSQTQARLTKAHLIEGEISFKEDLIIDRTLHLWAKSLENKAKFTSTKDFIAHMQTLIINEGSMVTQGNMTLASQGTVVNYGEMKAANLNIAGKTLIQESQVTRKGINGGYNDELKNMATMRATTGNLNVEAADYLYARGSKFEAKLNINLKSAGKLYLGAQAVCSEINHSSEDSEYRRYTRYNHKTQVNAGQSVNIWSGEGMIFEGVDVTAAGYIHAKSEDTLENRTVHNIFQEESRKESKGGFLKGKKTESTQTTNDTVVQNIFKAGEDVQLESEKDNIQQAPHIESGGKTTIRSNQGKVIIKADKSSYMTSTQSSSKSVVWQSQEQKGRYDEAVVMMEILAKGGIYISGAQGVEAEIGQNVNPTGPYEWIEVLRKDPSVTWRTIFEEHKEWNQKVQGLTGAAAAVIALAISIVTAGAGAALAGLAAGTMQASMASAAFTSLVTQASLSLINNQGDMGKVLKDMGSNEFLQSLATSIATAGATQGLSNHYNLPTQATTFSEHLQKNAVRSLVGASASIAQGGNPLEALSSGLINTVVDSVAGTAANNIGAAYSNGMNWETHKFLHGILGAGMSAGRAALFNQDPGKAALAGGVGAMFAEILAEASRDALGTEKAAKVGKVGTSVAALFANLDVDVAVWAGENALDNNFLVSGLPLDTGLTLEEFERLTEGSREEVEELYAAFKKSGKAFLEFFAEDSALKNARDGMINEISAQREGVRGKLRKGGLSSLERKCLENEEKDLTNRIKDSLQTDVSWSRLISDDLEISRILNDKSGFKVGPTKKMVIPGKSSAENTRPATSARQAQLLRNKLIAEEIGAGHALEKHVVSQGEFPGWIRTRPQLTKHIEKVLNDPITQFKNFSNNRSAYWHSPTSTVIIRNPKGVDGGTVFQPFTSMNYFENLK